MATAYTRGTSLVRPAAVAVLFGIFVLAGLVNLFAALALGVLGAGTFFGGALDITNVYTIPVAVGTLLGSVTTAAIVLFVLAIANFVAAWGIWTMRGWAWGLGLVLAVIGLFFVPIGTIVAILAIVYLATRTVRAAYGVGDADEERPRPVG